MFGWFKKKPPKDESASIHASRSAYDSSEAHRVSAADAGSIEQGLRSLTTAGLRFTPDGERSLAEIVHNIAEDFEGIAFSHTPTLCVWALLGIAWSDDEGGVFENAVHFDDHCYDVADEDSYSIMMLSLADLAKSAWTVDSVSVTNARNPNGPLKWGQKMRVNLVSTPPISPFELVHDKDFDWSVIRKMNAQLPPSVDERFAIFWDGDATIVFLTPDEIKKLNALTDVEFSVENDDVNERGLQ